MKIESAFNPTRPSYPYLARLKDSSPDRSGHGERIVLFTGPRKGVQVAGSLGGFGDSGENWIEDRFEPLQRGASVTLTVA